MKIHRIPVTLTLTAAQLAHARKSAKAAGLSLECLAAAYVAQMDEIDPEGFAENIAAPYLADLGRTVAATATPAPRRDVAPR